jgi:hypothetical protein
MKSCTWQAPLVVRRFKSPTGPLADCDPSMVYDFSQQRPLIPSTVGNRAHLQQTMNKGGGPAHATPGHSHLTTPDTHGVGSPFPFPK